MIDAVLVVPSPPMLLPEYVGLQDPGGALRERCVDALRTLLGDSRAAFDDVVIVTGREPSPRTSRPALGSRVGEHLLDLAGWTGPVESLVVPFDASDDVVEQAGAPLAGREGRVLLLVVADGSARRGEKAPGHLDNRAFAVDEQILRGLADADPEVLLEVDPTVAGEVLAHGRAALQVMAHAARRTNGLGGGLIWSDDPYGVMYALALWTRSA